MKFKKSSNFSLITGAFYGTHVFRIRYNTDFCLEHGLFDLRNTLFQILKQFYRAKLILLVAMLLLQWL